MKDFDVIIIGAGIGGLTCAGLLASQGVKVCLLEKHTTPGGYASSFNRGKFIFDSAVDCFSGLDEKGVIRYVLHALDVEDEIDFVKVDPVRESIFPGMRVVVDADKEKYSENLKELFPYKHRSIDSFFCSIDKIYFDIKQWSDKLIFEKKETPVPAALFKYANYTYKELLDEHIKNDEKLKTVLSDRCPFLGLAPSIVSAVKMTALMMSYFNSGAYRAVGGCQRLSDTLVRGIEKKGGIVKYNNEAARILVENKKAIGVKTVNGYEYTADTIVSNIDYNKTFYSLLNGASLSDGKKSQKPGVSTSFFILYIGTDTHVKNLGNSSSIGYFPSFEMEDFFDPANFFTQTASLGVTIPTILDKSLAPTGCNSISVHEMVNSTSSFSWEKEKDALTQKVLRKVEKILPNITENIIHLEAATPRTLERYTANCNGAAYGWPQIPGKKNIKFDIKNLYLAGHWGEMGGGVLAAAYSGFKTAKSIMGNLEKQRKA